MILPAPLPGFEELVASACRVCERPLTNPLSMRTGIGPVCARRLGIARTAEKEDQEMHQREETIEQGPGPGPGRSGRDIVLTRRPDGTAEANIPKAHRHHDTTEDGIEWGYNGSGPADLALNILAAYLPAVNRRSEDGIKLWDGSRVSRTAWDLHQEFKRQVIAAIPFDGAIIPADLIRTWIAKHT